MKKLHLILLAFLALLCVVAMNAGWRKALFHKSEFYDVGIPYAKIFQEQAPLLGWDWHMLAALAWHESHFNPKAHSYAGACGVMQLMPRTAHRYGLNEESIWEPDLNIVAGVQFLICLEDKWSFITNDEERIKFVLASYNAGHGNVFAARRLAKEANVNYNRWAEVEPFMNQRTTKRYVTNILQTANKYKNDTTRR